MRLGPHNPHIAFRSFVIQWQADQAAGSETLNLETV